MDDVQYYDAAPKSSRSKRLIVIVVVIIVLAILALLAARFYASNKSSKTGFAPTPTVYIFPTDTPSASSSGTPTPTNVTSTPSPTTAGLDKSTLTIAVENGSGTVGVASKMATTLKKLGYTVSSTGNADNFSYTGVTIQVKLLKKNYLAQLKKDLGNTYTITAATADLPTSSTTDAVVIIGK